MFALIRSLRRNRRLLSDFVKRDLAARYVGSSMGFFWSVVFPIVNLFVFMFVFRLVLKARWGDGGSEKETALIMLAGILVWAGFAETLSRATNCLVENANLIQKVVFPAEILPVYLTVSSVVNMLIGMPIVVLGCWLFGAGGPSASAVLIPLLLLLQIVFTVGLGYLLATLNLFLRDTYHLVGVGVQVWMFATPIFYPAEMVSGARIMLPDWISFLSNAPPGFASRQTSALRSRGLCSRIARIIGSRDPYRLSGARVIMHSDIGGRMFPHLYAESVGAPSMFASRPKILASREIRPGPINRKSSEMTR